MSKHGDDDKRHRMFRHRGRHDCVGVGAERGHASCGVVLCQCRPRLLQIDIAPFGDGLTTGQKPQVKAPRMAIHHVTVPAIRRRPDRAIPVALDPPPPPLRAVAFVQRAPVGQEILCLPTGPGQHAGGQASADLGPRQVLPQSSAKACDDTSARHIAARSVSPDLAPPGFQSRCCRPDDPPRAEPSPPTPPPRRQGRRTKYDMAPLSPGERGWG